MQLQKANGQSSRGPKREKKNHNGTKQAQNESTGEEKKNFTLHSLKTLLTSEPRVAKPMRVKQGT